MSEKWLHYLQEKGQEDFNLATWHLCFCCNNYFSFCCTSKLFTIHVVTIVMSPFCCRLTDGTWNCMDHRRNCMDHWTTTNFEMRSNIIGKWTKLFKCAQGLPGMCKASDTCSFSRFCVDFQSKTYNVLLSPIIGICIQTIFISENN